MVLRLAVDREIAPAGDRVAPTRVRFRVDVSREPGVVRVCPVGEVDMATIGQLRQRMNQALAARAEHLILDLRETTFLDSSGVHLAVTTHAWATRNGTEFAIIPGPPAVQRTFEATGLGAQLPFVDVPHG